MSDQRTGITEAINEISQNQRFDLSKTIYPIVGENAYVRIIKAFLNDVTNTYNTDYLELSQAKKLAFCHKLKTAAANIGAINLSEYCIEAQQQLTTEDVDISLVTNELSAVVEDINKSFKALL